MLDYWWNKSVLKFNLNYSLFLIVKINNDSAIACYKKFGFIDSKEPTKNPSLTKNMNLTNKLYIQKYLLPLSIKNLADDSFRKNNLQSFIIDRSEIIKNIQKYLSIS